MRTWRAVVVAGLLAALAPECSSDGGVAEQGQHGSAGSAGAGAAGAGPFDGSAGTFMIDTGTGSDVLTLDSACAGESHQAEQVPLAIYILLDSTGSMLDQGKWPAATSAINTFVNDPLSAGIKVAIQAFSGDGPCDGSVYDTPAVEMDGLPNHAGKIGQWLAGIFPDGQTPIEGALRGLQLYTAEFAAQSPNDRVVGLLITDGVPTRCDTNPATLTGIAAAAYGATPSISIFVMGMTGADFALLDQIAAAGGTQASYDASGGTQAFLDALEAIRGTALSCEFLIPVGEAGAVDPEKVNVEYHPSAGGKQTIYKVDGPGSCVEYGWYYDDPVAPTKILLCPETCAIVKADPTGRIDVILGCKSITPN